VAFMKTTLASVIADEECNLVSEAADFDAIDADLVGALFELVVNRCGVRGHEETRKNSSTPPS